MGLYFQWKLRRHTTYRWSLEWSIKTISRLSSKPVAQHITVEATTLALCVALCGMYQQDSVPPHKAGIVSNLLKTMFCNKWVGETVSIHRPPRPPDLIPLDSSFGATFYVNYYNRAVSEIDYRLQITLKQC